MGRTRRTFTGISLALALAVVAGDTASAATIRKSTFGKTREDWWAGPSMNTPVQPPWEAGRIRVTWGNSMDWSGDLNFYAPDKFDGNWRKAYKGKLSFGLEWDGDSTPPRATTVTVRVSGEDFTMSYRFPDRFTVTGEPERTFNAPLRPSGWKNFASGLPIDGAFMKAVLDDVDSLTIVIGGSGLAENDTFWLDNVKVKTPR